MSIAHKSQLHLGRTSESGSLFYPRDGGSRRCALATASNAAAGESDASIGVSALIEVLVTDSSGNPVNNLGSTVGDGTSAIALPSGWQLDIPTVPPGGCLVTPTQFANQRDGLYSIRVVPFVNNASCHWLSGDYIYRIQVNTASADGSALGVLSIR